MNTQFRFIASFRWKILLSIFLGFWVILFIAQSAHWQQVNDPAQLRYASFLVDHGMAPYRDLIEMNMPGIYLTNEAVVHTLGSGPLAWRIFDLLLTALAGAAMVVIAWPYDWPAGVLAAALFLLFHGRDGPMQTGQRDFIMAVMLLCAYAFLFRALRTRNTSLMFGFGLAAGIALTFKPTPAPFILLLFVLAGIYLHGHNRGWARPLAMAMTGLFLPLAVIGIYLRSEHALGSFISVLRTTLPYYATLGRKSFGELLLGISPSVWGFILVVLPIALWKPATLTWKEYASHAGVLVGHTRESEDWDSWESKMLGLGVLFGLASYFAQGKGIPYHRYPFLAFLFLWGALHLTSAMRRRGRMQAAGAIGIAYCLVLAPSYVREAESNVWSSSYINALTADLRELGGPALNGKVQCVGFEAECSTTLYRMRLPQATGLFYDFLIFGPANEPAIQSNRARFWQELKKNQPEVFVVHTGLFPKRDGYEKLTNWPLFANYLAGDYVLYADRQFPPSHSLDMAYRIYIRKDLAERLAGNKNTPRITDDRPGA